MKVPGTDLEMPNAKPEDIWSSWEIDLYYRPRDPNLPPLPEHRWSQIARGMGIAISVGRISTPGVGGCEPNAMFLCDCWTLTIDDRLWDIEAVWVHELAHAVGYLLMHTSMHDYGQHKELEENTADLVMLALAPPWEHRTAVRFRIRQQKTAQRQAKERILILNRIVTALEATPCPSTPSSSPASPSSPPSK